MADASYLLYHSEHDWAASTATTPRSGSRGMRRTRWARWCSSTHPRWAHRSPKDSSYSELESVKAVSDVVSRSGGEIVAVNDELSDAPEKINEDPYGEGWLVRVKLSDRSEQDALMDAAAYQATLS